MHENRVEAHDDKPKARQQYCAMINVVSIVPSPVWLNINIAPWSSRHGSNIVSMTQHQHRVAAKSPQQQYRQHDSTSTSRRG
jgi:hypothetical protein